MVYEVVYYEGDMNVPSYVLIGQVEGNTPEQALASNIDTLTQQIVDEFDLSDDDATRRKIQETLYVLRPDALVSQRTIERMNQ